MDGDSVDLWFYEREAWNRGFAVVAGVDEVGVGTLAGPVVAAAVILPTDFDGRGVRDSKALTPTAREAVFDRIMSVARVGVGIVGPEVIDEINVLRASHTAMRLAIEELGTPPDFILVDGRRVDGFPVESQAIVKGDAKSVSIAAASVIAKVTRDRIMLDLDLLYPGYGFAGHKGYCTSEHLAALARCGPCPCHRKSFAPVAERLAECRLPGLE